MRPGSRALLLLASVLTAGAVVALLGRERGAQFPEPASLAPSGDAKSGDAAPASPAASATPATVPPGDESPRQVALKLEHELTLQIERALVSRDAAVREAVFAFALPELLRLRPTAVIELVARQSQGEARDALRDEVARQWTEINRDAAVEWIRTLPDADRKPAAAVAVRSLAARSPGDAIRVADDLGVGRDDGSVDHILQIWTASDPEAARRWQAAQRTAGR